MINKVKAKGVNKTRPKTARKGRTSTSTLSSKNQLTVPVDILRECGLEPGDTVKFEVKDGQILIKSQQEIEHPFAALISATREYYKDFDLEKERSQMWPE